MKTSILGLGAFLFAASFVVGCGASNTTTTRSNPTNSTSAVAADTQQYLLSDEPAETTGVVQFRDESKDGQVVHVRGLVGGGLKPWIEGRAAFVLVDEELDIACAGDQCEPDCPSCRAELTAASTMVKFVDHQGQPLKIDARQLLGVKDMQSVVVRGLAKRDEAGNASIVADGIFLRR